MEERPGRAGAALHVRQAGEVGRDHDAGAYGLPDIYEAAYTSVDAVVSQQLFLPGFELKLAATNLFDGSREFTQGDSIQRLYQPGRTVSLSLGYSPF